jgi:hypothetical protein
LLVYIHIGLLHSRDIISDNEIKHKTTLFGHTVEFLDVKADGTHGKY